MPKCYKCGSPIVFVKLASQWKADAFSEKSLPIDIDPSAAGDIALYKWPVLFKGTKPANGVDPVTVGRRLTSEALRMFLRLGGAAYRVHFDTCSKRQ